MSENTVVNAVFPSNTFPQEFKFRFNKDDVGNKRANISIISKVASLEGIKDILELDTSPKNDSEADKARVIYNKNQQDLLLEAMYGIYRGVIGDWVGSEESNSQANFDDKSYSWAAIANMPKEDRRSSAIAPELWGKFAEDYSKVMSTVVDRTAEQLKAAITVFTKKFSPIKTNKPAIQFMQRQLAIYIEHTKLGESFEEILVMLVKKADELLKDNSPESLVANLGM